jgi:probable F420-dependent oxidoreductase
MNLGVMIFPTDRTIAPGKLARAAEEHGFESLWFPEHSHIPVARRTPWGGREGAPPLPEMYWRTYDQYVALMAGAAATTKLRLGSGITLVAQRDPIWLAKQVASVDALSGGRILFGIGYGWNKEEMAQHGVRYTERRALLREKVLMMKELWSREEAAFEGELLQLEPSWAWPKPKQQPHPPIIMGGAAGPRTFADIAIRPPSKSVCSRRLVTSGSWWSWRKPARRAPYSHFPQSRSRSCCRSSVNMPASSARSNAPSIRHARTSNYIVRVNPDQQLPGYTVTLPIFLSPVDTHVAAADHGCPTEQLGRILRYRHLAFDEDKRVRRTLLVDDHGDPPVTAQRMCLARRVMGHEHDVVPVEDKPYGGYVGPAVFANDRQFPGAGTRRQKRAHLVGSHCLHDRKIDRYPPARMRSP